MSQITFTEDEVKLAKEGLDFLINKGKFELTGVEAIRLSKQLAILGPVPALLNQYVMEIKALHENVGSEDSKTDAGE